MRIGIAMGLMTVAFVLLPMFFLWHDKRAQDSATHRHLDTCERLETHRQSPCSHERKLPARQTFGQTAAARHLWIGHVGIIGSPLNN